MQKSVNNYQSLLTQVARRSVRGETGNTATRSALRASGITGHANEASLHTENGLDFGRYHSQRQTGTSGASGWAGLASKALSGSSSGGLSLGSLFSGLFGLFGGGGSARHGGTGAQNPDRFQLAKPINSSAQLSGGGSALNTGNIPGARSVGDVHIHVQALDTQSLMDRGGELASAVRSAMLASHPINDVISEV